MTIEDIRRCVTAVFYDGRAADEQRLVCHRTRPPEAVVPGKVFRVPMQRDSRTAVPVTVTVYVNPGDLWRRLWAQEVRILLRLGAVKHAALARVLDGGYFELPTPIGAIKSIAYVVTDHHFTNLATPGVLTAIRSNPLRFAENLRHLVNALSALHRDGLLHRSINLSTITLTEEYEQAQLCISGFEMSTNVANLVRRGLDNPVGPKAESVPGLREQQPNELACMAPERLHYLFRTGGEEFPERSEGDVYSLGVVAAQCLGVDLDAGLLEAAFPLTGDPDGHRGFEPAAWLKLHRVLIEGVAAARIGPTLRGLLRQMLDEDPVMRGDSFRVLKTLDERHALVRAELRPDDSGIRRLVVVEPKNCKILQQWGWLDSHPLDSELGQENVLGFLEDELRDAVLYYAPGEVVSYFRSRRVEVAQKEMERAAFALRGRQGSHFGHLYWSPLELDFAFMIRWTIRHADNLADPGPTGGISVGVVDVRSRRVEEVQTGAAGDYPSWRPLLNEARRTMHDAPTAEQSDLQDALQWLLINQRLELERRRYPFTVEEERASEDGAPERLVWLQFDQSRDAHWRSLDWLRNTYCDPKRRPGFGDFFGGREDRNVSGSVRWFPDREGLADWNHESSGLGEVEKVQADRVLVRIEDGALPKRGWLEPAEDLGQKSAIDRQARAVEQLRDNPLLASVLLSPASFMDQRAAWATAADGFVAGTDAGRGEGRRYEALSGTRSRAALEEMLSANPLYVLQGPPGTGKTTLVARAVRTALLADPSQRILVSAQSHYALDNLAVAVQEVLGTDSETISIRLASKDTETKVDERLAPLKRSAIYKTRPTIVGDRVRKYLNENPDLPRPIAMVLSQWLRQIRNSKRDLLERTERGANLVFATCLQADQAGEVVSGRPAAFDLAIVEEAAKAQLTEVLIPLVRASRWTLVGDHRQLSAYRLREMKDFLNECRTRPEDERGSVVLPRPEAEAFFEYFGRFFTSPAQEHQRYRGSRVHCPVNSLNVQYRMVGQIGDVVRDAFYEGQLESGRTEPRPVRARIPQVLAASPLSWLSTDDETRMVGDSQSCDGEAAVVARLANTLFPGAVQAGDLAILSGYRRQNDLLANRVDRKFKDHIYTVDSFQGHEADVVIVSLARGYDGRPIRNVYDAFGHLADANRVNVLFSRAREYLILVGRYHHFRDTADTLGEHEPGRFWKTICGHIRSQKSRHQTVDLFGGYWRVVE